MPLPKRNNETKDRFMSRCMASRVMLHDFPDPKQRAAICYQRFGDKCACKQDPSTGKAYLKSLGLDGYDSDAWPTYVDEGRMCATGICSTLDRDRDGDIVEPGGIDTTNHQKNPIVLLDHGMRYALPIGTTEDPDGQYTLHIAEDRAIQTTYFDQNSLEAEQVFRLIADKKLRGNSLGFKPLEVKPLAPDLRHGHRAGKHVLVCDLWECSWTALPANPGCVTSILDAGVIGGKSIAPAIKAALLPYRLPRKAWANGVLLEKKIQSREIDKSMDNEEMQMSATNQSDGGAMREDYDQPEEEKSEGYNDENAALPLGAAMLRDLHADLHEVAKSYAAHMGKLENKKVKACLEKLMTKMEQHKAEMREVYKAEYPDQDPLGGEEDQGDEAQLDEREPEHPEEDGNDVVKSLKALLARLEPQEEPEDAAYLRSLERAVARREKLLEKFLV